MKKMCLVVLVGILSPFSVPAAIVYDNSANFENLFHDTRAEAGDEIQLAGDERLITAFSFEYFGNFATQGDETGRLRFYLNDGPAGPNPFSTPGTLLYDSGNFEITSGYQTVRVDDIAVLVPSDRITWTVQFSGVSDSESVGLLYYHPPTVGSSGDFFWERQNGAWLALAGNEASNNFGARVEAVRMLVITGLEYENGTAIVSASAQAGRTYALEFISAVTQSDWTRVAGSELVADTAAIVLQDVTAGQSASRFYRVVEIGPAS